MPVGTTACGRVSFSSMTRSTFISRWTHVARLLLGHTLLGVPLLGLPSLARAQSPSRTIDSLVTDAVAAGRLASVAVAVVQGNDTILIRAMGSANPLGAAQPATARTVYRLGSVTKQFTAAMILQLAQERRLALTDTLGRFLPSVPASWRGVTITQLLNHTSGLPSYTNLGAVWRSRAAQPMSPDSVIAIAFNAPLDFPAGTQWKYNNGAYVMLGRIIELLDRRSYAASVTERLSRPLKLTSLAFCPDSTRDAAYAVGSQRVKRGVFQPATPLSMSHALSAGGLCANVIDLLRWNRALHGGRVIDAASYQRMTTPEGAAIASHYGFGIGRDTTSSRVRLTHSGAVNGFTSSNAYWPDSALTIAVLSNTDGNDVDALAAQIERVLLHKPLLQRPAPIVLTTVQLDAHVGRFEIALPGRTLGLRIARDGSHLVATFDGDTPAPIVPIGPHRFMSDDDDSLQFEFQIAGDTVTLLLHSGPQTFTGRRTSGSP